MFINAEKDCQPECGKFKQFSNNVLDTSTQTATLVAAVIGILSTLLVIFFIVMSHRDKYDVMILSQTLIFSKNMFIGCDHAFHQLI